MTLDELAGTSAEPSDKTRAKRPRPIASEAELRSILSRPMLRPDAMVIYLDHFGFRVSEVTLRCWRSRGKGPRFARLGHMRGVAYPRADADAWIAANTHMFEPPPREPEEAA